MWIYIPGAGALGCAVWPGAGITPSQGIPPDFYPPHVNVGLSLPIPLPPPLWGTHTSLHLSAGL